MQMTLDNNNVYIPSTTGGTLPSIQPQPNVCPGCGRCNCCGRPYAQPYPYTMPTNPWITYTSGQNSQVGIQGVVAINATDVGVTS